jgi:hypothetical protein
MPSHGRGHWFDPSIAHPVAYCANRCVWVARFLFCWSYGDAVDGLDVSGCGDADFSDQAFDKCLALGGCAGGDDRVDPVGQLVNLPSWLWIMSATWQPATASASVPGLTVTATATPHDSTLTMGDGTTVTCAGPGTPCDPAHDNPASPSPDCGHTYRQSSAGQPGHAYTVTVTINWAITWTTGGHTSTLPNLTTTATLTVPVAESQAINTG